jgi:flagellar motor switch protein FliM
MSVDTEQEEIVLSSEELEALAAKSGNNDFEDGEFRIHDFEGGHSVAISKWSILDSLIEKHADALSGVLSSEFDCEISVTSKGKRFGLTRDLLAQFPDRICLISSPIEPFEDETHLVLPGRLLTTLVNVYFGGSALSIPHMGKRVTPSEQRVGERLSKVFLRVMNEIWSDRVSLGFSDLYVDVTPDRFALIPPTSGFVVVSYDLGVGDSELDEVMLIMPFEGLENLGETLTPDQTPVTPALQLDSEWTSALKAVLPEVNLGVRGELCEIEVTLRTLLAMKVGTMLPIDHPETIRLLSGDRFIAEGRYGAFEGMKSMQFVQFEEEKR